MIPLKPEETLERLSKTALCFSYLKQRGGASICTLDFHNTEIRAVQNVDDVFARWELGPPPRGM